METKITLLDELENILYVHNIEEKTFKNLPVFLDKLRKEKSEADEKEKEEQRWSQRLQTLGITKGILVRYSVKKEIYNILVDRIEFNGSFITLMPEIGGGCMFSVDNIHLIKEIDGVEYSKDEIREIISKIK